MTFEEVEDSGLLTRLEPEEVESAAHFITPRGFEYHGGEAVTRSLRLVRFGWLTGVLDVAGVRFLRDIGYALVASSRPLLSRFIHP